MALSYADATNSILAWESALLPSLSPVAPVNTTMAGAFGSVVAEVYAYLQVTANNAFLDTATGAALTAKAADLGVLRPMGTQSTASLTLTLSGLQPSGWQIDSTFTFSTQGDALNPPVLFAPTGITSTTPGQTTATVAVQSTTVGTAANVAIGTITALAGGSPYVLATTNAGAATGGTNAMSDAQLLILAQAALAPPGTVAQMQKVAAGVTGIVAAVVIDTQDGAGTVDVYAIDASNVLTGATTTPAVPTTGEALAILHAELAIAPPGLTIKVALLTVVSTNVTLTYVTQVAGSGLTSGVVITAVQTYMNALQPGATFYPSQLVYYLMTQAFPGQLQDVEPSSMAAVPTGTSPATIGIIRPGTVAITHFT